MPERNVDIVFENIVYPIKLNRTFNPILKSISGKFSSGQLTGIVGRSGAGKTTLLNILAGQISTNLEGVIRVNGTCMNSKRYKKSYLPQDVLVEPYLTVKESMMISANLILGRDATKRRKEEIVMKILTNLNMQGVLDTRTEHLSGGEKKRLSIATELINEPEVILLDEPTSGLDNVIAKECIKILKNLASSGKAVICSIHQPSDSIFKMFDHVYFIDEGKCVYNGEVQDLVPFLEVSGYSCPKTYNPADYILELDDAAYETLSKRTLVMWKEKECAFEHKSADVVMEEPPVYKRSSIGLFEQANVLLRKNYVQLRRKQTAIILNVLQHIVCTLSIGLLLFNNGNKADKSFNNFTFGGGTIVYVIVTYMTIPILSVPATIKRVNKDIRNGWYSPFPYLLAEVSTFLPSMVILTSTVGITTYCFLFGEVNIERILLYSIVLILTAFCSAIYGLGVGTVFTAKNGAIFGPASYVTALLMSWNELSEVIRQLTFARYSAVGLYLALYDGRENLECSQIFCPHASVERFFKDIQIQGRVYSNQVMLLSLTATIFLFIYYLLLRIKFCTNVPNKLKQFRLMNNL